MHMRISNLPTRLPDETLYSLVARARAMNGVRHDWEACAALFGSAHTQRVADYPADLAHFSRTTNGIYGSPYAVMLELTTAPFFLRLGRSAGDSAPLNKVCLTQEPYAASTALAYISHGSAHNWRFCPKCRAQEIDAYGTPYWHRRHQLPATALCTDHGVDLFVAQLPKGARDLQFWLPDRLPIQNQPILHAKDPKQREQLLRLAHLAASILGSSAGPATGACIHATIRHALHARGLLTRTGRVRRDDLLNEITDWFGPLTRLSPLLDPLNPASLGKLAQGLSAPHPVSTATELLLLIDWLFGSWCAFLQHLHWQQTMDRGSSGSIASARSDSGVPSIGAWVTRQHGDVDLQWHRRICKDFCEQRPEATRTQFSRAHSRSYQWLLRNDRDWLKAVLPIATGQPRQSDMFGDTR